jgi:hypothetical protein
MCQAGRKARKWALHGTDKKFVVGGQSKKGFLKIERTKPECV